MFRKTVLVRFIASIFITIFLICNTVVNAATLKGSVKTRRLRNKSNIVVCLKPKWDFEVKLPPINPMMDQRKLEFIPHVIAVPVGSTIDFLNNDKTKHNIFSPDQVADKFDFGYYDPGEKRSHTFKKTGSAALLCNKHDEMEGYVYVCDSHLIAVTDKKGSYVVKDVPNGDYTLKIWHKKLKKQSMDISVNKDIVEFDIKLKR